MIPVSPARRLIIEAYALLEDSSPTYHEIATSDYDAPIERIAELVRQAVSTLPVASLARWYLEPLLTRLESRAVARAFERDHEGRLSATWPLSRREYRRDIERLLSSAELALESEDESRAVGTIGEAAQ